MTCIECKHCMPLEERYDQVVCTNEESDDAHSNVEATHTCKFFEGMNYYTAIWEKRWQNGSHHHCLTKKTIFKADSPHQIMNSEYGDAIVYLFEGVVLTLGETFKEEDVKEL